MGLHSVVKLYIHKAIKVNQLIMVIVMVIIWSVIIQVIDKIGQLRRGRLIF